MATIRELLLQIPEYGEKALINIIKQRREECLNDEVKSASYAIGEAFTWDSSIEGFDFWRETYSEFKKNE